MGARLFLAHELALLRRGYFQRPLGQATGRRTGDFLHLGEIHIQPRPLFPEGMLDDNSSPLLGESADRLQFFGRQLPCCHDLAILDVREIRQGEFRPPILPSSLYGAKGVLHSTCAESRK